MSAQEDKQAVKVWFDTPEDPEMMHITIPIKHFSENEIGTVLCKGFFEDIKEMALKVLRDLRIKKKNSGILMAAAPAKVTPEFEVH